MGFLDTIKQAVGLSGEVDPLVKKFKDNINRNGIPDINRQINHYKNRIDVIDGTISKIMSNVPRLDIMDSDDSDMIVNLEREKRKILESIRQLEEEKYRRENPYGHLPEIDTYIDRTTKRLQEDQQKMKENERMLEELKGQLNQSIGVSERLTQLIEPKKEVDVKEIGARECIGLVKLMLRVKDTNRVPHIIDILANGEYTSEEREKLNKWRDEKYTVWQSNNIVRMREYLKQKEEQGDYKSNYEELVIKDIDFTDDNPSSSRDPQELSLKYRETLLHSNLFIVIESELEKVHIVKSRYFNGELNR